MEDAVYFFRAGWPIRRKIPRPGCMHFPPQVPPSIDPDAGAVLHAGRASQPIIGMKATSGKSRRHAKNHRGRNLRGFQCHRDRPACLAESPGSGVPRSDQPSPLKSQCPVALTRAIYHSSTRLHRPHEKPEAADGLETFRIAPAVPKAVRGYLTGSGV